jgi:hypothetical protein
MEIQPDRPAVTRAGVESYLRAHDTRRLASDAVFTDVTTGLTWAGRRSIESMVDWLYHGVFDAHLEDARVLVTDDGGDAVLEATFVGVHRGEFAGVPPTGRTVRVPLVVLYRVVEGRIAAGRVHFDVASFRAQACA